MNRIIFLAAALACAAPAFALPSPKPVEAPADPEPYNSGPPAAPEGTGAPVPAKSDADLARGLTAALLDDPGAPHVSGLSIAVKDGKATLRGVVRTQKDKDVVTAKAGAVAGLRNVANMITVSPW